MASMQCSTRPQNSPPSWLRSTGSIWHHIDVHRLFIVNINPSIVFSCRCGRREFSKIIESLPLLFVHHLNAGGKVLLPSVVEFSSFRGRQNCPCVWLLPADVPPMRNLQGMVEGLSCVRCQALSSTCLHNQNHLVHDQDYTRLVSHLNFV